jgi:processive 1,2-diacylglycerol beta-glucosyltransferase
VKQFRPDVVLCTHYFPLETLNHLRRKRGGPRPMVVGVVTDFEAHALWMDACVDVVWRRKKGRRVSFRATDCRA